MQFATRFLGGIALLLIVAIPSCTGTQGSAAGPPAATIHEQAIVIDAHAHPTTIAADSLNPGELTWTIEVDLDTMNAGGLDAVFFTSPLLGGPEGGSPDSIQIFTDIRSIINKVEQFENRAEVARSAGDIQRIHALGKRAILLGIEATDPFAGNLGLLERYFSAGVRMITLQPQPEPRPDSEHADQRDPPLSSFGSSVVEEMNRLGIVIDITHIPDRQQMDIISTSTLPVVASHSNTRALNNIPRQMPDSIIRALAEKGGLVCVTFHPSHISEDHEERSITVADLVDHIDHIVQIVGVDHVGLGSDFLGVGWGTVGLESAAGLPNITHALLERGYPQTEVEKIMGGNLLHLFEVVQEAGR